MTCHLSSYGKRWFLKNIFQVLWLLILKSLKWHQMLRKYFYLKRHIETLKVIARFTVSAILNNTATPFAKD